MDEENQVNQESVEKQKIEQLEGELENIGNTTAQEAPPQPSQPIQQPSVASQPVSSVPSIDSKPQRLSKSKGILWVGVILLLLSIVGIVAYYLGLNS